MALAKTEFELKLVGPASDIAAVPLLGWLKEAAAGPGEWARLVTTYFDSADRRLHTAGLSLRVREEAGVRTLSAKKSGSDAGAILRTETERAFDGNDEAFSTGVAEIDGIIGSQPDDLIPIARTVTDRWTILVSKAGGLVEVSAETGRSERLGETPCIAPLAEIELELMKGDGAALFVLAGALNDAFDGRLRLSAEAKLDRALRGGETTRLGKPARSVLAADAGATDLLSHSIRPISLRILESASLFVRSHDADAARQLRVALRRLRALEQMFRDVGGARELAPLAARARDLARVVGAARDLDVFARKSLGLAAPAPGLAAAIDAKRAEAQNAAALALSGLEFGAFTIDLMRAALLEPWRTAPGRRLSRRAIQYTDEVLERRWARLNKAAAQIDPAAPATLHPLRLALKKFRYAAQFSRDLYDDSRRRPFFASMSVLQDALGELNDAVVASEIAASAALGSGPDGARAAGFISGYRIAQAQAAALAITEKWAAFSAMQPFWNASTPTTSI